MSDTRSTDEIERELERDREQLKHSVESLQDTFSPENIMRTVTSNFRAHGGDIGKSISTAARDNPLALALTGVGLGWLIFGQGPSADRIEDRARDLSRRDPAKGTRAGRRDARDDAFIPPRGPVPSGDGPAWFTDAGHGPTASQRARAGLHNAQSAASDKMSAAGDRVSDAGARVGAAGRSASDSVRAAGASVSDGVSRGAGRVRDRSEAIARSLSEGTESLSESARERIIAARERAIEAREQAGRYASRGVDQAQDFFEEHPIVAGALAFAVGAAIAGALPRTRMEDEHFGEDSDRLYHEAEAIFAEEKAKALRVADAAMGEARKQGEKARSDAEDVARSVKDTADDKTQGSGSAADAVVDRAEDSVRRVAEAAKSKAEEEKLGKPGS